MDFSDPYNVALTSGYMSHLLGQDYRPPPLNIPPSPRGRSGVIWNAPSQSAEPAPVVLPPDPVSGTRISDQSPYFTPPSYGQWLFRHSHHINLVNDGTEQTILEFQVPAGNVLVVRKIGIDAQPFGKLDILWRWYGGQNGVTPLFEYQPGVCAAVVRGSPQPYYCNEFQPESLNDCHIVIPSGGKLRITATGAYLDDGGISRPAEIAVFAAFAGWYFTDPKSAPTGVDPADPFITDWVNANYNPLVETVETATQWAWQEIWTHLRDPRPPLEIDLLYYGGLIDWATAQPSGPSGDAEGASFLREMDPWGTWY